MLRAFLSALFILLFVRAAFWAARLLTGGRSREEIPPGGDGSAAGKRFEGGGGSARRRRGSRKISAGEIVDVPFTEVPPPESTKRM